MVNIHLPIYDSVRLIIKNMKDKGNDWEAIENQFDALNMMGVLSNDVDKSIWIDIVKEQREEYYKAENIEKINADTSIIAAGEDNDTFIPTDPRSSWQLYKQKLLKNGWRKEAVQNLEKSTLTILKKLNKDTTETGPVKGLVIGQVQSGKTASMAGLMAMAADWGWNSFIVLSGMIENLRVQTENRLITDLNNNGTATWIPLHKVSKRSPAGYRLQDLHMGEGASERYLNVCLKNKTRLENLIAWLNGDKNKLKQMKILIIDDEADQASVNTKNIDEEERAKINKLIIDLVEVEKEGVKPKAVNYISYTATPYSNFLNESDEESLYPKDFIGVLPVSDEYYGPKQIFGLEESEEYEGLDIVRDITEDEIEGIKEIQEGELSEIPKSFQDSICWFLCATAAMRYFEINKPFSMLVHTSQKQAHHSNIANAIAKWINSNKTSLADMCKEVYQFETSRFTKEKFRIGFTNYPVKNEQLNDYPKFEDLVPFIKDIISWLSHIEMDDQGDLNYHKGIHLCIDNSSNTGITDENMHVRLAYPSKKQLEELGTAPAFIIVGGSTLSRGLTIEGLVSTYFLRASTAADSLMQMGRWFGYRKNYEMFPRIWMSKDTYGKFRFLTLLEHELREELEVFALGQKSPSEYGPRVKNTPKVSWLRITAKNKMQNAEEINMDFTGSSIQTIHFENNFAKLRKNIDVTENFLLNHCGSPIMSLAGNAIYFKDIDFGKIKDYLLEMDFNSRSRVFNQIETFCDWYEQVQNELNFSGWNVIVAGAGNVTESGENKWFLDPYYLGKVHRSAKLMNYTNDMVNIGVLRGPSDVFADINNKDFHDNKKPKIRGISNTKIKEERETYGLGDVPQLIIYRIDKDSEARTNNNGGSSDRRDLNFKEDIIGIYMNIPGDSAQKPHAKALRVRINVTNNDNNEE
ncbi:Z1 domain-containing protein [Ferdinandcohnia sp. Marseille-Q9671]